MSLAAIFNLKALLQHVGSTGLYLVAAVDVSAEEDVSLTDVIVEMRDDPVDVLIKETEIKEDLSRNEVTMLSQSVREIDDDWFLLLDVPTRELQFVPPGIADLPHTLPYFMKPSLISYLSSHTCFCQVTQAGYAQTYAEKGISTLVEERLEVVVEEMARKQESSQITYPELKIFTTVLNRDDDWFLLLDVVPRERAFVPPGTHIHLTFFSCAFHTRQYTEGIKFSSILSRLIAAKIYPDTGPVVEAKDIEPTPLPVALDQMRERPSQPQPEKDDDWFVAFDAVRDEALIRLAGIPFVFALIDNRAHSPLIGR